jgi:hypothetical protein
MFNTSTATKKYVPVQDRPKFYAYGGISPRAKRFGTSVRQLVHHDGGKDLDTKPACLAVLDDDANLPATNGPKILDSPEPADIFEEKQSRYPNNP